MPSISRQLWVVVHRWAGLTIALFLMIAGATGILLPWRQELTFASRPSLSRAGPPTPGAKPLDAVVLAERVETATGAQIGFLPLTMPTDHVVPLRLSARPGAPALGYDTVWVDPYSGRVKLAFRNGVLADGAQNIMPFLFRVHSGVVLGDWAETLFGVAALIWVGECLVGFCLTFPLRRRRAAGPARRSWLARWRPAWMVRLDARGPKLHLDLHRAGGLWVWPLMLVFAWSAVGFTLPSVERPVMAAFGAQGFLKLPPLPHPLEHPPIGLAEARRTAAALMRAEGVRRGFTVEREGYLSYVAASGAYRYMARTSLDRSYDDPRTTIWVDARSGRLAGFDPPQGTTTADGVKRWLGMLHMARVFGVPYRMFVSLFGLLVVGASVTGVLIWTRRRSLRLLGRPASGLSLDRGTLAAAE